WHVKPVPLGRTCTSSLSLAISMPTKVSLSMCSYPRLVVADSSKGPGVCPGFLHNGSGDRATKRPLTAKDVTIYRCLRLVRCRIPSGRASPHYAEVPCFASTKVLPDRLLPHLEGTSHEEQVPWGNIQGCGERSE